MTAQQREILDYLKTKEQATIHEIYDNVSWTYYNNYAHYIGELMSNLVRKGLVERIKPGIFRIKKKQQPETDFTGTLFENIN
jgi:predicted transcriptional regulator of viral defense system